MIYEADSLTDWGYQLNQKIDKAMQELVESIGSGSTSCAKKKLVNVMNNLVGWTIMFTGTSTSLRYSQLQKTASSIHWIEKTQR